MFVINEDKSIYLTRGDVANIIVGAAVSNVGSAFINFQKADGTAQYVTPSDIGLSSNKTYTERVKTIKRNITCKQIICYFKSNEYGKWSGEVANAQLEIGTEATEYEEYKAKQTLYVAQDESGNSFYMNYPNTTIINDAGATMELSYVADTKLYIDNKIAEFLK